MLYGRLAWPAIIQADMGLCTCTHAMAMRNID